MTHDPPPITHHPSLITRHLHPSRLMTPLLRRLPFALLLLSCTPPPPVPPPVEPASISTPTWRAQDARTGASLRGVAAIGDRVAWVSGTRGTVLRTLDGGVTWERL